MIHKFYNGRVILGNTFAPEGTAVYTENDRIIAVTREELDFDVAHDAKGKYISPGFIDMHVHGGNGYDLRKGELEAFIEVSKLPDRSVFAGSVCTTNKLVRNMTELADVSLLDAVRMASTNPARMVNLRDRGAIREGNFADILIFDENIDVSLTMVNGRVVFEKE